MEAKTQKPLIIAVFLLLTGCSDPGDKWGNFTGEEICNAGVALKFGKGLDDLSTRYLANWKKYAISYVRASDKKPFTYYCVPTATEALIVENIEDAGSHRNKVVFEVVGDSLQIKQVFQGKTIDSYTFTKGHFK